MHHRKVLVMIIGVSNTKLYGLVLVAISINYIVDVLEAPLR